MPITRRRLIQYGSAGLVYVSLGGAGLYGLSRRASAATLVELTIEDSMLELVDGNVVFVYAFAGAGDQPRVPGPVIRAVTGESVVITVHNDADETHRFAIPGVAGSDSGDIPPGQSRTVNFSAPSAGTYLYIDPLNAPVNRVLGLHGVFVVLPTAGNTPYSVPTTEVQALFNALGSVPGAGERFPGDPWQVGDPAHERIWVFNQIDPAFNALAEANQDIDHDEMVETFLPRYFTLNGLSGFDASHDPETFPRGFEGEPTLIRTLNAGLATHSPHIHGNHVFELSTITATGAVLVQDNVIELDTWTMPPEFRKDVLLPFEKPPDIPDAAWPPRDEPFPMRYPMHCHTEMSQTAGGGNYPQGLITDWELEGPLQS